MKIGKGVGIRVHRTLDVIPRILEHTVCPRYKALSVFDIFLFIMVAAVIAPVVPNHQ